GVSGAGHVRSTTPSASSRRSSSKTGDRNAAAVLPLRHRMSLDIDGRRGWASRSRTRRGIPREGPVRAPLLPLALGLGAGGCSPAGDAKAGAHAQSADDVRAAIAAQNAEFARAIKAKDTAALTHLFTEDGVLLTPAGTIVKGWPELERTWVDRLSTVTFLD